MNKDEKKALLEYTVNGGSVKPAARHNPKQSKYRSLTNWGKTPAHLKKPPTPVK